MKALEVQPPPIYSWLKFTRKELIGGFLLVVKVG